MLLPQDRWADDGAVKGVLGRLLTASTRVSTPLAVAASLGSVLALAALDLTLGRGWSIGLLYLIPIAFAAWRLGAPFAVAVSLATAATWTGVEVALGSLAPGPVAALWAVVTRAVGLGVSGAMVAEMRRLFERERGLARHDDLTGALSGRAFRDVLDREVARATRDRLAIALVYVDLDDFKQVNDRLGHAAGDETLAVFARATMSALGDAGHLARTGGDEFVMLLSGDARPLMERARAAALTALRNGPCPITATMGAVVAPAGTNLESGELVRRADAAMYEAKRGGKGGLVVFELGQRGPLAVAA